jgi:nitric-oxide synthase
VRLQTSTTDAAGYVDPAKFEIKARHRHLNQLLCVRCQGLSNGAMLPGVADFAQRATAPAADGPTPSVGYTKALLMPEQLRQQLTIVRQHHALVILLVDLLDASGSILGGVRDLVGSNPIVLVGTKADLLPTGTDPDEVAAWLVELAAFKRITVADVHVLSSRSGANVSTAVAAIRRERKGRDVYVLGAANVGKSAFIRALVGDMSRATSRQYDPMAAAHGKLLPVESPMPGTTLGTIPLKVFSAGGLLYDTPGLHLHHRMPHLLTPEENKALHPRKKLRAYVAPAPAAVREDARVGPRDGTVRYCWGGLVVVDMVEAPEDVHLVFYGPPALRVTAQYIPEAPADAGEARSEGESAEFTTEGGTAEIEGLFGAESVKARGGLRLAKALKISKFGYGECLADVAVSGLPGWIAVYSGQIRRGQTVNLRVLAPVGVEVFQRPPMPTAGF